MGIVRLSVWDVGVAGFVVGLGGRWCTLLKESNLIPDDRSMHRQVACRY